MQCVGDGVQGIALVDESSTTTSPTVDQDLSPDVTPSSLAMYFSPPANTAIKRVRQQHQMQDAINDTNSYKENPASYSDCVSDENDQQIVDDVSASDSTEYSVSSYVLELLSLYGYDATPFDLDTADGQNHCWIILKTILLDHRQREQKREETATHIADFRRIASDQLSAIQRLKVENEDLHARLFKADEALTRCETAKKKQQTKMKAQIVDLQKKSVELKSRDKQYKNDIRKREIEYERAQDRLRELSGIRSKNALRKPSKSLLTKACENSGARRVASVTANAEMVVLQDSLDSSNQLIRRLREENSIVVESMRSLHKRLSFLCSKEFSGDNEILLDERCFDLPFEQVRQDLDKQLEWLVFQTKSALPCSSSKNVTEESKIIDTLQQKLEHQRKLIAEQDKMLQTSLLRTPSSGLKTISKTKPLDQTLKSNRINFFSPKTQPFTSQNAKRVPIDNIENFAPKDN